MTLDEIKSEVEKNGDVLTITMDKLRDAYGAGRLGGIVRQEISQKLAGIGLGHVPDSLPGDQAKAVRLFKYGTPVGDLIRSALTPGSENDEKLRTQAVQGSSKYAEILDRIRDLVAE